MPATLKCADVTRSDLVTLIGQLDRSDDGPGATRIWAEAPDGWSLDYWPGLHGELRWCAAGQKPRRIPATDCISRAWAGRIFDPAGELRWRVIDSLGECCCRTVFLGQHDRLPDQLHDRSEILQSLTARPARYVLWGQQSEVSQDDWVELQIPHRFRYPVPDGSKTVQVLTELWCDAEGDLHFLRLVDLEPYEEDN